MRSALLAMGLVLLTVSLAAAAAPADLDIPLTVRDVAGVDRVAEPVSTAVPLPCGLLAEPAGLAVIAPDGKAVPAQFDVLERWREKAVGKDDLSIKWLLVTFLGDCPKGEAATYRLRAGANPAPAKAASPADSLAPFQLQFTDPDGKRSTDADVNGVAREVVEAGPVRATVKFESPSSHQPFGFIAYLRSYAGSDRLDLTVVLKNGPRELAGPLYFKDFSVAVAAAGDEAAVGGEPGKAVRGSKGLTLYQASDGGEKWDTYANWRDEIVLDWSNKIRPTAKPEFRGYRVTANNEQLGEGDCALGWIATGGGDRTAVLANRWFWQNYPSAVEFDGRQMLARLWPKYTRTHGGLHWLDDLQRKRFDLSLQSRRGAFAPADGDAIAMAFDRPLLAHCGVEWYRKTGMFGDLKSARPADEKALAVGQFPRSFSSGVGWVTFGGDTSDRIKRRYHSRSMGGFIASGNPWEAYALMAAMDHSTGMNCLHLDDYQYPRDALLLSHSQYCGTVRGAGQYRPGTGHHGYKPWNVAHFDPREVFDGYRLLGDPLARLTVQEISVLCQGYADYREKNPGQLVAGTRADGNPMSNLAECYRILGDKAQLDCLDRLAEVSWKQVNKDRGNYGVMSSWEGGKDNVDKPFMMCQVIAGLREHYELTANERTADQMLGMLDFILDEASLGQWGYSYVVKLDGDLQTEYRNKLVEEMAKKGQNTSYSHLAWAFAWGHWYSGEPSYRDSIDNLNHKAYPHVDRHYVTFYPERDDRQGPPAVSDLKAEALGDGKVKLTWTTPADASRLQIKFADQPMVRRCWPGQCDSRDNWWAATHVEGEPAARAGAQSMVVENVPAGAKTFALRSFDAARNRSEISNQVTVDVK